jgi:hypothetical protein
MNYNKLYPKGYTEIFMTEQDILDAGYKEYSKTPFDHEGIEKNYQKCISDKNGKRYFIDIHKWKDMKHPYTGEIIKGGYEFTSQMNHFIFDKPMDINLFSGWTIEEAEQTIERIWEAQFKYYERYDE